MDVGADEIRPTNVIDGTQTLGEILVNEDVSLHRTPVERGVGQTKRFTILQHRLPVSKFELADDIAQSVMWIGYYNGPLKDYTEPIKASSEPVLEAPAAPIGSDGESNEEREAAISHADLLKYVTSLSMDD